MGVVTARPDSTDVASAIFIGGGQPTAGASLADDFDSSYIYADYGIFNLGFAEPTIPGGARFVKLRLRVRSNTGYGGALRFIDVAGWATIPDFYIGNLVAATEVVGEIVLAEMPSVLYVSGTLQNYGVGIGSVALYEMYLDAVYVAQPVVAISPGINGFPYAPLTETNIVDVGWTHTLDADGGPQAKAHAKIFTAAQVAAGGFNPETSDPTLESVGGVTGAATGWTTSSPLPNGEYRAYVKIAQIVNGSEFWSAWSYGEFEIDISTPAVPDLTATVDDVNHRVSLGVDDNTGDHATEEIQIEASYDGGVTWAPVRTALGEGLVDTWDGTDDALDYDAPNGGTVSYRARSRYATTYDLIIYSEWTDVVVAGSWSAPGVYLLKHPTTPALNIEIRLVSPATGGVSAEARQGVFQPAGSRTAVAITDHRLADTGSMKIRVDDDTEHDALLEILTDGVPLLFQAPVGVDERDRWLAFGAITTTRYVDAGPFPLKAVELAWTEVDRPGGGLA